MKSKSFLFLCLSLVEILLDVEGIGRVVVGVVVAIKGKGRGSSENGCGCVIWRRGGCVEEGKGSCCKKLFEGLEQLAVVVDNERTTTTSGVTIDL